MHKNRSVVFVIRNKKILVERLNYPSEGKDDFYSIPGGGIEDGETPEQAALRELKEECGLDGTIVQKLSEKDRAFLWGYGLIHVPGFFEEAKSWGDEISYPRGNC